ncbi:MAG: right-handed parallel beta-helix repeat-containing protein [Planctomycetota bacterium]|jgi:parallel beta-helix repeat protein
MVIRTAFLIMIGLLTVGGFAGGATIHVPDDYDSIQKAIDASVDGDTIIVKPRTYFEHIDFIGKAITVKSEQGPDVTVIDGEEAWMQVIVTFGTGENGDSILDGFTLINSAGGGIYCMESSPTIRNNIITKNVTSGDGGGIFCVDSSPTITNNVITENSAWSIHSTRKGGGICCYNSSPVISNNLIRGNHASHAAGIYFGSGCSSLVTNNNIAQNNGGVSGGICCDWNSSPTIMDNTISGNSAGWYGGGIHCYSSSPIVTDNTISDNASDKHGGGIYCYKSVFEIKNNTIKGNTASYDGGGIYCEESDLTVSGNTISQNSSKYYSGGGIFCLSCAPLITNNTISWNAAKQYGGGICSSSASPEIMDNIIMGNTNEKEGGGGVAFVFDSKGSLSNNIICKNSGHFGGGIACFENSSPSIVNNAVYLNSAAWGGGIYCYDSSSLVITNNTVFRNTAINAGGGIACYQNSFMTVRNTILWNNGAYSGPEIFISGDYFNPSTLAISYSDLEGGKSSVMVDYKCTLNWGPGMIDADPMFMDPEPGSEDFHLQQDPCQPGVTNPCVDAGSNTASNLCMDTCWTRTDGEPDSGMVDMGFHYGPHGIPSLKVDAYALHASTGGKICFELDAGLFNAGRNYLLLGGVSGTNPGTSLPGGLATLPLNWDAFTDVALLMVNTPVFEDFLGTLDGAGRAAAQLNAPQLPSGYVGVEMCFAYCLNDPFDFVSNPIIVEIVQ